MKKKDDSTKTLIEKIEAILPELHKRGNRTNPKIEELLIQIASRLQKTERTRPLKRARDLSVSNDENLAASRERLLCAERVSKCGNWELHLANNKIFASEGARLIYGLAQSEWSLPTLQKLPLPEYRATLDAALANLIHRGETYDVEFKIKKADSGEILDIHSTAEYSAEKQVVFGVIQDITRRKHAEDELRESEEKFRTMAEQLSGLIFITDAQGIITYISTASLAIFDYTPEEMIGQHFTQFLHETNIGQAMDAFTSSLTDHSSTRCLELNMRRKDGSVFVGELSAATLTGGNLHGTIGTIRDISERKLLEVELTTAKERAEESDRLKTAFLHNVSHEIRTPMNGILGFSEMLKDANITSEKRDAYIEIIHSTGQQLISIIDDIIKLSSIEAHNVEIKNTLINVNSLMHLLYEQFVQKAEKKNLQFTWTEPLPEAQAQIYGDYSKLTQVMCNLLANAFKFTTAGCVSMGCQLFDDRLEFFVADTGVGIAPQFHQSIFHTFRQGDNTISPEGGGIGLGLTICKAYVEIMGGDIWLESDLGNGATFRFSIPYRPLIARQAQKYGTTGNTSSNGTILVVGDETAIFQLINIILLKENYTLVHARDSKEAMNLCGGSEISMVLLDMQMPAMDGYLAAKLIRRKRPELPIVALSVDALGSDLDRAMKSGCDDYLAGPIKRAELLSVIKKYL